VSSSWLANSDYYKNVIVEKAPEEGGSYLEMTKNESAPGFFNDGLTFVLTKQLEDGETVLDDHPVKHIHVEI